MAVGEHDVSSITKEKFDELLQQKFIGVAERMRLTLRKASEKTCEHQEFKFGALQKEFKVKPADLSLALVFCKDKSRELPVNFPVRNYDIIYQVSDLFESFSKNFSLCNWYCHFFILRFT